MSPVERPQLDHYAITSSIRLAGQTFTQPSSALSVRSTTMRTHFFLHQPLEEDGSSHLSFAVARGKRSFWKDLSILYLCPLKALLNNLEPRLARYLMRLRRPQSRTMAWRYCRLCAQTANQGSAGHPAHYPQIP